MELYSVVFRGTGILKHVMAVVMKLFHSGQSTAMAMFIIKKRKHPGTFV